MFQDVTSSQKTAKRNLEVWTFATQRFRGAYAKIAYHSNKFLIGLQVLDMIGVRTLVS
jgi:hypothetical protein